VAQQFLTNIDLKQNELVNAKFHTDTSDPSTGNFEGRLFYNSAEDALKYYDGSTWQILITGVSSSTAAVSVSTASNGAVSFTVADATTSDSGLMSATDKAKLDDATDAATASKLVIRDASGDFSANVITASRVTNLSAPTDATDAANKAYVDAARSGLDVKASVRVATTGDISLTNTTTTVDNITLADGDRILVKDQNTASENGIYVVSTSGSWSRASDADSSAEVTPGLFTFVEEGDANADSGWVLTNDGTVTLDTTGLTFAKFSGAGQIIAGDGLSKSGTQSNQIDVNVDDSTLEINGDNVVIKAAGVTESQLNTSVAGGGLTGGGGAALAVGAGTGITVNADDVQISATYAGQASIDTLGTVTTGTWEATDVAVAHGGTGASTAADARDNLAETSATGLTTSTPTLARISSQTLTTSATSYTLTHNLGTEDVIVQVFDTTSKETVHADVARATTNTVTVEFATAPSANAYKVVITG